MGFHPFDPAHVRNQLSIPENIVQGNYVVPSANHGASEHFTQLIQRSLQLEPYRRFRNHQALMNFLQEHWSLTE